MADHILVVDDHRGFAQATGKFLECKGYRATIAYDGMEALAQVDREVPDLIILDIMMPALDGWATLEQLQSKSHTAATPVLMLTALTGQEHTVQSFQAGCTWFYAKPITDFEDFALVIRGILDNTSSEPTN